MEVTFEQYVSQQLPSLRRLAHLLTGDWAEAEDLVQDALLRCERRWGSIVNDDPHGYVRRAVVNAANNWRRRRRLDGPLPDGAARDHAPDVDARVLLLTALRRLPLAQRQVVVLRFYEQMTEAETAAVLGVAVGTVKSRLSRALASLREAGVGSPSDEGAVR